MSKHLIPMFALCLTLCLMTGCFHQQVIVDSDYQASRTMPDYQELSFQFFGLIGVNNKVSLNEVCPGGAGMLEKKALFIVNVPPPIFPIRVFAVEQIGVYCK